MTMRRFIHDGLNFAAYDSGDGAPVIFQHGMGGDVSQINEHFPLDHFRCLTLECRGHGGSEAGAPENFSIAQFANDILAYADDCGISRFAIGGISMGAAIALRIAVIAPDRVSALILARPAWAWSAAPRNMQVFLDLALYLRRNDRTAFEATAVAKHFAVHAPDNYNSLLAAFARPNPALFADIGTRIATSGPDITEHQVAALTMPTLVLGNDMDLIHPMSLAEQLSQTIPGARLLNLTAKAADKLKHALEFRAAVTSFLNETGSTS